MYSKMTLKIKMQKIADVPTPNYAHKGDSGVDLYSTEDYTLKPLERKLIPTGLKLEIPYGYEGQVRPKSGLALNHGLSHANSVGTIDSSYRGEIKVPLINLGHEPYKVEKGKKIGQLVFAKVEEALFEEVKELEETTRNESGFGSTGF
jgi:dUTP pyrophosphatase